jgi:hypothetical protein
MALSGDGQFLYGASPGSHTLWVLDTRTGEARARMPLDGAPVFVLPAG